MIVQCGSCKTRFKISDDKVTDRGVKVRCSKCGTVFVVKKGDGDEPMSGAAALPGATKVAPVPLPAASPAAQPRPASSAAFESGGSEIFEQSTRVSPIPRELLGASLGGGDPFADLGAADPFGEAPPAPGSAQQPALQDPFPREANPFGEPGARDPFGQEADPFGDPAAGAGGPPAEADPFAQLGLGPAASVPGMAAQLAATPPSGPVKTKTLMGHDPFAGLDLGAQPAPGPIGALSTPPPAGPLPAALLNDDPFEGMDLAGGGRGNRGLGPPPPPPAEPPGGTGSGIDDPFAHIDFGDKQSSSGAAGPPSGLELGGDASLPPPPSSLPPAGNGDPFGVGDDDVDIGPPIDLRSGRELPAPAVQEAAPESPRNPPPEALAQPGFAAAPAQTLGRMGEAKEKAPLAAPKPARSPVVSALNAISGLGLVLMALIAFVAYRNDGKLDLRDLDVDTILLAFGLDLTAEPGASTELVPADISNGLYATATGKQVFYVRGRVMNRGTEAKGPAVRVAVELLASGSKPVARVEAWAGGEPTPEQVHRLTGTADWQKLALETGAANAGPVAGGASSPFLVVFADVPAGLEGLKVRVAALATDRPPAPPPPAAPRPGTAKPEPEKPVPHKGGRPPKTASAAGR